MALVPIGPARFSLNASQIALLLAAGKFATEPDMMPVFYAYLQAHFPADLLWPPDKIPGEIAAVSADLATPIADVIAAQS